MNPPNHEAPQPQRPPEPPKPPQNEFKTGPIIDPVNFESGSTSVKDTEAKSLDKAAEIMKGGENWTVMLVGLADASGDPATNKDLTQKRCDAVQAELNKRGVADTRIVTHAIGERLATDSNNVRQRKVEFVFYTGGEGMSPHDIAVKSRVLEADYRDHQDEKDGKDAKDGKEGKEGKEGKGGKEGKNGKNQ
jgi:outer membrane protein OmpA-like peptidoglycan-associated protein